MSNHDNARRGEKKHTEHGPTWEGADHGGCNNTHVARSRAKWAKARNRTFRRTGKVFKKFRPMRQGCRLLSPLTEGEE